MSTNCFTFKIRTQFSFIVDDCALNCILSGIAKQKINITGYFQTKFIEPHNKCHNKSNCNIVRVVVGSADCENCKDLLGLRGVLDCIGVAFEEKSVIQVVEIASGTPGLFSYINSSLLCKVTINAIYVAEETRFIIDVSDICEALKILSKTTVDHCQNHCGPCCYHN